METSSKCKPKYQCYLCKKEYVRKTCFDTHVIYCELLTKTREERKQVIEQDTETPNTRDLYVMIQQLVRENDKMKEEIKVLKKVMNIKNIKITLAEWLHTNCSSTPLFMEWFNSLTISEEDLNIIYKDNVFTCLYQILLRNLDVTKTEKNPIQCFSEKKNTLFIASERSDNKKTVWKAISVVDFKPYLEIIQQKLMTLLLQWKSKYEVEILNMNSEENDQYMKTIQQIISINQKQENRIANYLIKNLYQQMHISLPDNVMMKI